MVSDSAFRIVGLYVERLGTPGCFVATLMLRQVEMVFESVSVVSTIYYQLDSSIVYCNIHV